MQMLDPSIAAARMYSNSSRFIEDVPRGAADRSAARRRRPALALDILLFIANNPDKSTARDVCQFRGMKPGIVSFHVDRLAAALLERRPVPGDRRKTRLVCTEAAADIIRRGREAAGALCRSALTGLDRESLETFHRRLAAIDGNIDNIRRNRCKHDQATEKSEAARDNNGGHMRTAHPRADIF